jgi:hypothetical protein
LAACSPSGAGNGIAPASAATTHPTAAGNASVHGATPRASQPARFTSTHWGFTIPYPEGWALHHGFPKSYLQSGSWKTYAPPNSHGTPVVALVVPGSNRVTDAEIRIGVSRKQAAVAACAHPPQSLRAGSLGHTTIGGTRFTHFEARDAAMSHYLKVHSYRTVRDDTCYAIDLLVYGTNPRVYSPPRTPPFGSQQAFARMRRVLAGFRFTR